MAEEKKKEVKTEPEAAKESKKKAKADSKAKPKKESILAQAKKLAQEKQGQKLGKSAKKKEKPEKKKEVKKGPARVFTIPLKVSKPRMTRTRRAVSQIKLFVEKHTKQDAVLDTDLNEYLWERGRKKPPASIRVSVETDDDGRSVVSLKK